MVAIKWCHRRNNKLWLALCFSGRYSHGKWLHAHTHTHTHLISAEDGKSIYIMEEERIILLIWKLLLFNVRNMVAHASQRQHQLFFFRLLWTFATSTPIHAFTGTGTNTHAADLHSCQMINGLSTEKVHKFPQNYHGRQVPDSIFPVTNLVKSSKRQQQVNIFSFPKYTWS